MSNRTVKTKSEVTTYFERRKGYFQDWETIKYRLSIQDKNGIPESTEYEIVNFLHRYVFRKSIIDDISMFSYWTIQNHETLFSISDMLYGSPYYFWIIVLLNNMSDPLYSWPLNEEQLLIFCQKKYGRDNINKVHHYESADSGDLYSLPAGHIVTPPLIDKDTNPYLIKKIKEKYGEGEDDPRKIIDLIPAYKEDLLKPYAYSYEKISNYEYEVNENNKRKKIKLMKPQYLQDILEEKEDIVKANFIHINRSLVRLRA